MPMPKEMGPVQEGPKVIQGEDKMSHEHINANGPEKEQKNVIIWNPGAKPLDNEVSRQFMEKDLAASGINPALLPDNVRPVPTTPTAEYPNGRYQFPYPFSNGAMYRIRNNLVGSTLPKSGDGRVQQRYDQPGSNDVGAWANAPYIVEAPRAGPLYIAEGPKKTLSLVVNGLQTVGLAGAFNYMNGNAHSEPRELNDFIVKHLTAWLALRSHDDPLVIVPDPDAFERPDIGRPYWHMVSLIQEAFPSLPIICRVFPDKIDDLIGRHGFEKAWSMGEDKAPMAALAIPLIDIAKHPVFPRPLLVTHAMKKDKDVSYVAIQDVNAANLLANHPRMAGRYEFDLSMGNAYMDGSRVLSAGALTQSMSNVLAHDLGFQHNGHVLATRNLEKVIGNLSQECGFYPMQRLVATLPEWDGIARLDEVGVRHCGFKDDEWSRLWMRSFVLWAIRRGIDVGCDCRLLWLLQGAQRVGKTRLPSTLFGDGLSGVIKHSDLKKEDEIIRRLYQSGHIAIIDDLDQLRRDMQAALKGLISAGSRGAPEQVRFLYLGEIQRIRHFILFATSNMLDILNDDLSGNTRYLAVQTTNATNQVFDYKAIEQNRGQILAEAYAGVKSMGEKEWTELEAKISEATGEASQWAVQESEQYVGYYRVLRTAVVTAKAGPVNKNDAGGVAVGPYKGDDVYAIKPNWFKEEIHRDNPKTFVGDVSDWLKQQGWKYSETHAVLGRQRVFYQLKSVVDDYFGL